MQIIEASTKNIEWEGTIGDPEVFSTILIDIAQLDADPALELVLSGLRENSSAQRILIVDGISQSIQDQFILSNLSDRVVKGVHVIKTENGSEQLAVISSRTSSGGDHARLHVYNLATGNQVWQSEPFLPAAPTFYNMESGNFDGDSNTELFIAMREIHIIFDLGKQTIQSKSGFSRYSATALFRRLDNKYFVMSYDDFINKLVFFDVITDNRLLELNVDFDEPNAMKQISSDFMLIADQSRLHIYSPLNNEIISTSDEIGTANALGQLPALMGEATYMTGNSTGLWSIQLNNIPFASDGFESSLLDMD